MSRSRRSKLSGFTLAEAIVSLASLSVLSLALISLFNFSVRGYQGASLRQNTQAQILSARLFLEQDFKLSNFRAVNLVKRSVTVDGETVSRDGIAIVGMSNWDDPGLYDSAGFPRWDRYITFYATTDPAGRLVRQIFENPTYAPVPLAFADLPNRMANDPLSNPGVLNQNLLANKVLSWDCEVDTGKQAVIQNLKIREQGGRSGSGTNRIDEVLEATFQWELLNTVPKL